MCNVIKKIVFLSLVAAMLSIVLCASADQPVPPKRTEPLDDSSNRVVIYSASEDYKNEYFLKRLNEEFPEYDITIDYMPSGNLAAKVLAEGSDTDMDIYIDVDFSYADRLVDYLADLSDYDQSNYLDDCKVDNAHYLAYIRTGSAIIINPAILEAKGLEEPTSYADLLKPEYKNLISMPNPKSSGVGYMFLKNLVNAWGEEEAFTYFDELAENILQFTSSGLGPVNALVQGEAAIGLGEIAQAVNAINSGVDLKIIFFEEGAPFSLYGYAIPEGKQTRKAVKDVFDFFYTTLVYEDKELFYPEQIFIDQVNTMENFPKDIPYGDMSGNTTEEKIRLIDKWEY